MRHAIGQSLLIGISGPHLTTDEKKFIVENNISGVTLFGRNIVDAKQVYDLCTEIQSLHTQMPDRAPLFIGIDMEGGRVHRLKNPFTIWPAIQKLGQIDNPTLTFSFANKMGLELRAVGINLNYAPCTDTLTNSKNTAIGDRALGSDPELVAKHSSALVRGYIKSEIICCSKHFPGHGHTILDSHDELPIAEHTLEQLEKIELIPFRRTFKARVDLVMTCHILFKNIDSEWPVTFSEVFLKKILREDCRYRGLIITDDLGMKALTKNYEADFIPVRALQAGADLLLYCNEPEIPPIAIESILGAIAQGTLDRNYMEQQKQKILDFKKEKLKHLTPVPWNEVEKFIGNPDHQAMAKAIAEGKVPENLPAT